MTQAAEPDLDAGIHYCHRCRRRTAWHGAKLQRCEQCGDVFPCPFRDCGHQDCNAMRARWGQWDWTDLFEGVDD